jgi:hypothetical protein
MAFSATDRTLHEWYFPSHEEPDRSARWRLTVRSTCSLSISMVEAIVTGLRFGSPATTWERYEASSCRSTRKAYSLCIAPHVL